MALRPRIICFIILFSKTFSSFGFSSSENFKNDVIRFLMIYETNKPLNLNKSVLYFSKTKWLIKKQDSIVLKSPLHFGTPDTIVFDTTWKYPVYLTLKLYFSERTFISNTFYFSADNPNFDAFIRDASLQVGPKFSGSFSTRSSLNGIALILEAILEMIIAYFISKLTGSTRHLVLMVLAANIAAFPLYMINITGFLNRELLVFGVKAVVMILVGLHKISIYRVLLLLIALTIISLGFKELFFFIVKLV